VVENTGYINMTIPQGAGALYSTTEDLLKWEQGLFGGKVIQAGSLEKMTTPYKSDYAFGLTVRTVNGHKVIDHGGGIEGFNTMLAYYPDDKLTVIVLANLNGQAPSQIADELAAVVHGETVTLTSERKEITVDPKVLSRYVGAYQMQNGPINLITLEGNQLSTKLGNQQALPIYAQSETKFFLKAVDAQVEFSGDDGQGRAAQMTIHQNGRDMVGKRMNDAEAKKLADQQAAIARRFKDQTAAPGSEAAVKRMVEEIRAGKPNYELMSTQLGNATRQQLARLQPMLTELGALQSVTFKGVGPGGADIYEVKFEKGSIEYRLSMTADGKVDSAGMRPL